MQNVNLDKDLLTAAIDLVEEDGPRPSVVDLYKAVASVINETDITVVDVRREIQKWNLVTKTQTNSSKEHKYNMSKSRRTQRTQKGQEEFTTHQGRLMTISTPAGACPVSLTDTDFNVVSEWVQKVQEAGYRKCHKLTSSALAFYARQFYPVFSDEYKVVKKHIDTITAEEI